LDIIKDRIYTTQKGSIIRRSSQTALYYIAESFVRWIAPILSFTADEIWQHMPGERSDSVFLEEWYQDIPEMMVSDDNVWATIIRVRNEITKILECLREEELIGSSLDAKIIIFCKGETFNALSSLGEELHYVLITSEAELKMVDDKPENAFKTEIEDVWITATVSEYEKCIRCWHHKKDVGNDTNHPKLCLRCVKNIDGEGEKRLFA